MHSRPSYLAMFAVLLMGASVSSTSCSSNDVKDAVADFDAACKKMFTASCAALAQCEPVVFGAQYKDVGDCAERTGLQCAAYAKGNGIGWSAEKFDGCTSSLMAIACSEVAAGALASGACAVPAGHLPLGSACTDGVQCASLICDKSAAAAPDASKFCGACSAGCGSACAAPNVCVQAAGVWKCIDLLPEGAPCSASTLSCTEGTQCMGGTCKRRGGEGADCTQTLDCDYTRALDCFEQKCTRLTLAEPGAVCGDRSTCAQGYHCVGGTTTHPDSTCIPPVADGATCNALTVACRPPAACYGQVCTLPADAVCR